MDAPFAVSLNDTAPTAPSAADVLALDPDQAAFRLTVVCADNLMVADVKSSDPYIVLKYNLPQDMRQFAFATTTGGEKKASRACLHTTVRFNTLNPVYNEVFELRIPGQVENQDCVFIELWDYDRVGDDDYMGCCMVPLENLVKGESSRYVLPVLEGTGTVTVDITALNFSTGPTDQADLETRYLEGRKIEAQGRALFLEERKKEAKEKRIETAKKVGKTSAIALGVVVALPIVVCIGALIIMTPSTHSHRYRW